MFDREVVLYKALQNVGVSTSFVTYGDRRERSFQSRIPGIKIFSNNWNLPSRWYEQLVKNFPPDGNVYKSNQVSGARTALAAARRAKAQFIARCGYLLSTVQKHKFGPLSAEAQQAAKLESEVFDGADRVVVTTAEIAAYVGKEYQINSSKIRVIPNYVETNRFRPQPLNKNERFRIGFVGRLATEKNLLALLASVRGLDVELCLVGYGPLHRELAQVSESMNINANFLGILPNQDLPRFLNSCDLFILPSLYEGHPKALLEAMACGLPVIGTRVSGIKELIRDGETGLLCETDPDSMRASIQRALGDPDLCKKLGINARKYIEDHFSLQRILDLELAVLAELGK
jgi:glycosyltransferase involved in cell wall biosynthesis